ncbi:MAG: zinc-ribbon domain-containing protein [Candidatus Thorarchaeota archaeon]
MVYCKECGTNNDDTAVTCSNCGVSLHSRTSASRRAGRDECFGSSRRAGQDECFGLPQGGTIVGIIIGIIIILTGIQSLMGWNLDFGPYMIILVGILIVAGALYQMNRSKR